MNEKRLKRLSNLMLVSGFISCLFYSASYPYIYAELVKVIPTYYISLEQLLACLGTIVFCRIWNKQSDRLFKHYRLILVSEVIADLYLFIDVLVRKDLSFYFLLNVIIFSIITRNLACGSTKMRALVNPTDVLREQYDNNSNILASVATLVGTGAELIFSFDLNLLFILALIGNTIDNLFYFYIYECLRQKGSVMSKRTS